MPNFVPNSSLSLLWYRNSTLISCFTTNSFSNKTSKTPAPQITHTWVEGETKLSVTEAATET